MNFDFDINLVCKNQLRTYCIIQIRNSNLFHYTVNKDHVRLNRIMLCMCTALQLAQADEKFFLAHFNQSFERCTEEAVYCVPVTTVSSMNN